MVGRATKREKAEERVERKRTATVEKLVFPDDVIALRVVAHEGGTRGGTCS